MRTALGSFLKQLRIENDEILKNMADKLGVRSAFLSAVENGKKKMPESWYGKLSDLYELSEDQMENLKQANMESQDSLELNIANSSDQNRRLAISFARQFDSLDDETTNKIMRLLNKKKSKEG